MIKNETITERCSTEVPEWNIANHLIFPLLEGIPSGSGKPADVSARTPYDPLSGMLSNCIKMSLALYYRGTVIPLTESLISEWAVSFYTIRIAMESNVSLVARTSRFERHEKAGTGYFSVHTDASPFNAILPFYQPFQETVAALVGFPFYFAVPEHRTVILFGKETLPRYLGDFHDDILLTYETSTRSLSSELIEVSESGLLTVST